MACRCCCNCCYNCCSVFCSILKGWIILNLYGAIGWFLFSYTEDDLNVTDCFRGLDVVAAKHYPDEARRLKLVFERLGNLTNQTLSANKSIAVYYLFYNSFQGSASVPVHRDLFAWDICLKWYRFSMVTITTIGFGKTTPKTDKGKMLVIPYALFGIPMVLAYLAFIGIILSRWTSSLMMCVHKLFKGPLKYKSIKHCFYIFLFMWIILFLSAQAVVSEPGMPKSWLDCFYFYFVAFTTIGYGDIVGPGITDSFFGLALFFGLSIISGVVDSFVKLTENVEIGVTCEGISCRYTDEEKNGNLDGQLEQAIDDAAV